MRIDIIAIGNSKGIRLSKALLQRYELTDEVELVLNEDHIVLKPTKGPRHGWDRAFKRMAERGDDAPLLPDVFADEDIA
ncbi:MAG: AbrB/MazE/SpoVT family DNA-binding domain-containing protein [Flavobacteriales bacterium]|nr:AbrB/MazE/SpoVT family DNA-binding domain-containing protein [Flavobacteriales bacterium]HMQ77089.1 AbrB/MazE/SpoVT family DNA-binding domain-containing protein [Flavobacteriales bacterium]HMR28503.1 AbrB/MazE/SpoVT family DNA-binding domain-containing protein [Flavobacteriales bacterium]